jgi:hypothetical protein
MYGTSRKEMPMTTTKIDLERIHKFIEPYKVTRGDRFHLRGWLCLAHERRVHLQAVHRDLDRGVDPQPDLIAADVYHRNHNVIADDDTLIAVSRQDQHSRGSFLFRLACLDR